MLSRISLAPGPSLHPHRIRWPGIARRLHSYYGQVCLLSLVHRRLWLLTFRTRIGCLRHWPRMRSLGSRTRSAHACWGLCPRRAVTLLAIAQQDVLPSGLVTPSALGIMRLRGSMASLALICFAVQAPADASPCLSWDTTRGRCDSLGFHRNGLSPPTPCRSPDALPTRNPPSDGKTQSERFIEMARELGCHEDEAAFKAELARIARQKPKDGLTTPKGEE